MAKFNGRKQLGLQKIGAVVSKMTGLTKLESNAAVRAVFDLLALSLLKREVIIMKDFGTLSVRRRTGRNCFDVGLGTTRHLPDRDYIHFKANDKMKDALEPELAAARTGKARVVDTEPLLKRLAELASMMEEEGLNDIIR